MTLKYGLPFQLSLLTGSFLLGQSLLHSVASLLPSTFWIWVFCGTLFGSISFFIKNPPWWHWIHLMFFPLLYLALSTGFSASAALWLFALLLASSWGALTDKVPLFLSNRRVNRALLLFTYEHNISSFVDLGSGLGSTLHYLARHNPQVKTYGIENAPLSYLISRLRLLMLKNSWVYYGNLWDTNISKYYQPLLVYVFLSPEPMEKLWNKLCLELPPNTWVISNAFEVPQVQPFQIIHPPNSSDCLFVYRIPHSL